MKRRAERDDENVGFYSGAIPSRPSGASVDVIHDTWAHDMRRLERHHGFIQWLFPVFENTGVNLEARVLTKEAAAIIRADVAMSRRVLRSYKMMLDFFGLELADEHTGRVERAADAEHARRRLAHLNSSFHNFLRISRILTSLGELGFHRYKEPLLARLAEEVENGSLRNARGSLEHFWSRLVGDEAEASEWYHAKTLEVAADRQEGCLFDEAAMAEEGGEAECGSGGGGSVAPQAGLSLLSGKLPFDDVASESPLSPTWPPRIAPES